MLRQMLEEIVLGVDWWLRSWYGQCMPAANLRKAAPNFTLSDSNSTSVRLADYKAGSPSDFWATWCHGCQTEIPWYMGSRINTRTRTLGHWRFDG